VSAIGSLGNILSDVARYALGGVRLAAGTTGLLAPRMIISRFGDEAPSSNAAAIYGLRLFGIRTILIGLDLWRLKGRDLDRAVRAAPLIHASDTATVFALQQNKQLSPERARPLLLISGVNTVLAVVAFLGARRRRG
jgi:hypothetical protein